VGLFTEQAHHVAARRGLLTTRARWWAVGQMRREHASVAGLARQLGCSWRTLWRAIQPLLAAMAADQTRFAGVATLGVDEHIWYHVKVAERGPKELTGMVDLTRDQHGKVHAAAGPGAGPVRSGKVYTDWLTARGQAFRSSVTVATLDPFHGYVLDAFHVVKLGTAAVDEVRRWVQQDTTGHRGRSGDPLYGIRTMLRAGQRNLTDRQLARLDKAIAAHEAHDEVHIAWQCAQRLRAIYHAASTTEGGRLAEQIVASFPGCPIPEIARLGRTLKQWRTHLLAYFDTGGASNGGTEAINGLIELHRRVARGFRNPDNYRLRMLLIAGGLSHPNLK